MKVYAWLGLAAALGVCSTDDPAPEPTPTLVSARSLLLPHGLSLTKSKLSGSLGIGFQSGTSPTTQIGIPPFIRETKVSVKTFQLLYSISYAF